MLKPTKISQLKHGTRVQILMQDKVHEKFSGIHPQESAAEGSKTERKRSGALPIVFYVGDRRGGRPANGTIIINEHPKPDQILLGDQYEPPKPRRREKQRFVLLDKGGSEIPLPKGKYLRQFMEDDGIFLLDDPEGSATE